MHKIRDFTIIIEKLNVLCKKSVQTVQKAGFKRDDIRSYFLKTSNSSGIKTSNSSGIKTSTTGKKSPKKNYHHKKKTPTTKKFICDICQSSYSALGHLDRHKLQVHNLKVIRKECSNCKKMIRIEDFDQHVAKHNIRYECKVCGKEFDKVYFLKKHEKIHSSEIFSCDTCESKFKTIEYLKCHIKKTHLESAHCTCEICDRNVRISYLPKHMLKYHSNLKSQIKKQQFFCDLCSQICSHRNTLLRHMKRIHLNESLKNDPNSVRCTYCTKYILKENLKAHMDKKHVRLECDKCEKVYFNLQSLQKHQEAVHEKAKFLCDICKKNFISKSLVKSHILAVHLQCRSECKECGKVVSITHLQTHMRFVHGEEKKYVCETCEKPFKARAALRLHIARVHLKQKNYDCSICDKSFSSKGGMMGHLGAVHGKSKFKCEKCDRSFSFIENYRRHLKCHKKNPYPCSKCKFMCKTEKDLKKHVTKIHEKRQPVEFKCKKCDKVYKSMAYLQTHERKIHLNLQLKCHFCGKGYYEKPSLQHHIFKFHV